MEKQAMIEIEMCSRAAREFRLRSTLSRRSREEISARALCNLAGGFGRWPQVLVVIRCAVAVVFSSPTFAAVSALGILVPAYFYPSANSAWDTLNRAAPRVPLVAIMNPFNGPASERNPDYTRAVTALHSAGGHVIGYVYTSYTARLLAEVKADIDRYISFYSIDGFFVDEMNNTAEPASYAYYADLYQFIKAKSNTYLVVGNPGTSTQEEYLSRPCADSLVVFENYAGYDQYQADFWTTNYPANRFGHLVYAVSAAATMSNYVHLAQARNAGFIFITDDLLPNPWDTLPAYWEAEVSLLQELNRPRLAITPDDGNTIRVDVCGAPGLRYVLEASTNLAQWTPISTNQSSDGKYIVTDVGQGQFRWRFFRAKQSEL
jgi:hypothetical protein